MCLWHLIYKVWEVLTGLRNCALAARNNLIEGVLFQQGKIMGTTQSKKARWQPLRDSQSLEVSPQNKLLGDLGK